MLQPHVGSRRQHFIASLPSSGSYILSAPHPEPWWGEGLVRVFSLGVSTRSLIDYALFLENGTGEMDQGLRVLVVLSEDIVAHKHS